MKVLDKKLYRNIINNWTQALAVAAVVLCGTACYIAVSSSYRNLVLTRDTYYSRYNFADFEVMLERAPMASIFKIEEIPGIRKARGRIVEDVNLDVQGQDEARVGRIISMPAIRNQVINDIHIVTGRYFEKGGQDEVIMSDLFAHENNLVIGDRIKVSIKNKKYSLKIIGLALSPEYVYMIRSVQELIPSPERFGVLWVPQEFAETALDMKGACNNIVGSVDSQEQLGVIFEELETALDSYGVFAKIKQENQLSNRFLSDEIRGMKVMCTLTPTVFLGVAALILFILLNRMVRKERTQIGLLKSYGYSDISIAVHYIKFALALAVSGCLGGFFVGQWLSVKIVGIYVQYYQFPVLKARVYPDILTRSMGIAIGFALMGALAAVVRAVQIKPAESMRPEAPHSAHKIGLERITMLWRRLSFTWKMIVRNVFRNPFRAGVNVLGVSLSIALMMMGLFTMDSLVFLLNFQFREVQREDVTVRFITERGKRTLYEAMRFDHVKIAEPLLQYPFELKSAWAKKDTVVIGFQNDSKLRRLANKDEPNIDMPPGKLILSERLAEDLGVATGDNVTLKPLMGRVTDERTVPVYRVVKQYLGTYAFMELGSLSALINEPFAMNAVMLKTEPGMARELNKSLKDVMGITSVEIKEDAYKNIMKTLARNMSITNWMLLTFAGVISFSIIYNVTTVSLAERERELASLRVLGFSPAEVGRIVYNENLLLMVVGIICGIPMGIYMSSVIADFMSNELYRLPFLISDTIYIKSIVTIAGFVILANLTVRHKLYALDMVETLKARE